MLGEDVLGPYALGIAVQVVGGDGLARGLALQHLETVRRHEQGARGLVQSVVRATDPLDQPRAALGRGQLNDKVHRAPVDAEVEGSGADHRPKFAARHGRLDPAPLLHSQAAVVQRYGQVVVVDLPQHLEGEFRLEAGVDEHQRGAGALDGLVDVGDRVFGRPAAPGRGSIGDQHVDHRRRSRCAQHEIGHPAGRLIWSLPACKRTIGWRRAS